DYDSQPEVMMLATDPVCGMVVDIDQAPAKQHYKGETYYFCSTQCRDRFDADPQRYASSREATANASGRESLERHEPPFTTKPITAPKFGSAGSGGAEYERT